MNAAVAVTSNYRRFAGKRPDFGDFYDFGAFSGALYNAYRYLVIVGKRS